MVENEWVAGVIIQINGVISLKTYNWFLGYHFKQDFSSSTLKTWKCWSGRSGKEWFQTLEHFFFSTRTSGKDDDPNFQIFPLEVQQPPG